MGVEITNASVIKANAFENCSSLQFLNMQWLTTLEENAFYGCSKLTVSLPDTVTSIGSGALVGTANTSIYIPKNTVVADVNYAAGPALNEEVIIYATSDSNIAQSANYNVRPVTEPARVRSNVGDFYNYTVDATVQLITVPGVIAIKRPDVAQAYYWYQMTGIEEGATAFLDAESLEVRAQNNWNMMPSEWVNIPQNQQSVITIYIKTVDVDGNVNYYHSDMMTLSETGSSESTEFTAGDFTYTTTGSYAVLTQYNGTAESLEIPSTVSSPDGTKTYFVSEIGNGAFAGNTTLKSVMVNSSTIGEGAFLNCSALTKVTVYGGPDTIIKLNAFKSCTALEEVMLLSVGEIGESAFEGCTALNKLQLQETEIIGSNAFAGCS